ncbi:hypothetical protein SAMN05444422_101666 [Halobiforma haloterrestris]|uniref:Uncharacterized protein n=1 Tax=Natronobacterium haloterrestre TaxID=148448 RepID=A0A1I1DN32_NATHA|nr:hypothetical protein [Halobiforma haloterrestris]SFB74488.1 hypothetical protein SAMN05444422_101666 [Halobiforma haloterrestris]
MERAVDTTTVDGVVESRTIWPREDVTSEQAMRLRSSSVGVQLVGTEPFWDNQEWSRMSDIQDWVSDA